jgi:hypothetical protein
MKEILFTDTLANVGSLVRDSYFTPPLTLSATTAATGHSTFTSLTNSSNLTAELDTTAGLTALIPTNAAFAAANVSGTEPTTPSLMDGHIVPNFVGYLPALTNGLKLITQAGTTVTVTVQGNDFYLNNAKIIASNLILQNGVAHVLDQVRRCSSFLNLFSMLKFEADGKPHIQVLSFAPTATPTPTPSIIPYTGAGSSILPGASNMRSVMLSFSYVLLLLFGIF